MQRNSTSFFWNTDSFADDAEGEDAIGLALEEEEALNDATSPLLFNQQQHHPDSFVAPPTEHQQHRVFPIQQGYASIEEGVSLKSFRSSPRTVQTANGIRFQVVLWYVGAVDVVLGHVPMRFRVTLFWNDDIDRNEASSNSED